MSFPSSLAPSRRRRRLVARLAALAAATSALSPAAAHALDVGATVGPYVSFTFGEELGVGWGVESTVLFAPGSDAGRGLGDDDWGVGPALQIGAVNLSYARIVGAVAAGGALGDEESVALLGEAGVALHVTKEGTDAGIHTGFVVQAPYVVRGFARAEWLLDEYSVGAAVGFPHLIAEETTGVEVAGRALRDAAGRTIAPGHALHDHAVERPAKCDGGVAIAGSWATDAQSEAASIPAFLQLAAELLAHGAPDDLVARAIDAAEDEIRHAALCARHATQVGGRRVVAVIPASPARPPLRGRDGLTRLAVESWIDGCVSEGAAAARARWAATHATDGTSSRLQRAIARDEARHAALGWDVLRWAMGRGGDRTAEAVASLRDVAPPPVGREETAGAEAVTFGRTPRRVAERLHERHVVAARRALERELVTRAAA